MLGRGKSSQKIKPLNALAIRTEAYEKAKG
jgi:hypothetical protein